MHPALTALELQSGIIEFLADSDRAALARSCRAWYKVAMAALWSGTVISVEDLLDLSEAQ